MAHINKTFIEVEETRTVSRATFLSTYFPVSGDGFHTQRTKDGWLIGDVGTLDSSEDIHALIDLLEATAAEIERGNVRL